MQSNSGEHLSTILERLRAGNKEAESHLIPLVYKELHAIAGRLMRQERSGHTLQPTALVNEAYIRMISERTTDWKDRAHFFSVAAQVMRHVLVDHARQRLATKRGSGAIQVNMEDALIVDPEHLGELLVLEDALKRLEAEDPRATRVLVNRFYGGLSNEETAEALQISVRTVKRDLRYARAWLKADLSTKDNAGKRLQQD